MDVRNVNDQGSLEKKCATEEVDLSDSDSDIEPMGIIAQLEKLIKKPEEDADIIADFAASTSVTPAVSILYSDKTLPNLVAPANAVLFLDWDGTIIKIQEDNEPVEFINAEKLKKLFFDAINANIHIHIVTAMRNLPNILLHYLSKLDVITKENEKIWLKRFHFVLNDEEYDLIKIGAKNTDCVAPKKYNKIKEIIEIEYKSLNRNQFLFCDDLPINCQAVKDLMTCQLAMSTGWHLDELQKFVDTFSTELKNKKNPATASPSFVEKKECVLVTLEEDDLLNDIPNDPKHPTIIALPCSIVSSSNNLLTLFAPANNAGYGTVEKPAVPINFLKTCVQPS